MKRRPTVTQLVDFSKCEKLGALKLLGKEQLNARRQAATARGDAVHRQRELQTSIDGRCFVASFAFGADAPRVAALRSYRDEVLGASFAGRGVIRVYYALSPLLVAALRLHPKGRVLARLMVMKACAYLGVQ